MRDGAERWPELPLAAWKETYQTLHMYTQIAGKIRVAKCPMTNQWWQSTLYLTARGLTTSPIPCSGRTFELDFDFFDHQFLIQTSTGETRSVALGLSVKDFYQEVMASLQALGLDVRIRTEPSEVPDGIPFDQDTRHATYDPAWAHRFWRILLSVGEVFNEFRTRFRGKCSPVHFFWGGFDLAVTRFSGRPAPPPPDTDRVTRLAYDEEVISLGFWPGGSGIDGAAFYSYTKPTPPGLDRQPVRPAQAFYEPKLDMFLLMYDDVRLGDPARTILEFAQSTYDAGARLADWPDLEYRPSERG